MSEWLSFLVSRGASLGASGAAHFGDPAAELAAARDATIVADLSHNALLAVTGDDAVAFLHGQLTNDVEKLPEGAAQWTGWCNAKGRLFATFLLVKRADGCLLMLPAALAEAVAKRLRMYVLRSKVKIEDASDRLARIGFAGKSAAVLVGRHWDHAPDPMRSVEKHGITCVALERDRFVILAPPAEAGALWDTLAANAQQAGSEAWEWTSIRAGVPTVGPGTQEELVPQMANFELVGGVSFKKGCYPGQEVVARTQYRGTLKRRLVRARVAQGSPRPGDALRTPSLGEQAAGIVVNVASSPAGGHEVLASAPIDGIAAKTLTLADGTPLEILDLPYAVKEPA